MGLEPTTLRLRVWCSTDWANRAGWDAFTNSLWLYYRSLLGAQSTLTSAVMDALSNLNMANHIAAEVCELLGQVFHILYCLQTTTAAGDLPYC